MNWKKIGRMLVCVALVLCILVNASPVRASASMVVAPDVTLVAISPVVSCIMNALGISPSLTAQGKAQHISLVDSCISYLQSIGLCKDLVSIDVFGYEIKGYSVFGVSSAVIDAVRSWIYSNNILKFSPSVYSGLTQESERYLNVLSSLKACDFPFFDFLYQCGVNDKAMIVGCGSSKMLGFYFDEYGALYTAYFENPYGVSNAAYCTMYSLSDLTLVDRYPETSGVFYSLSHATAYPSFLTSSCTVIDWSSTGSYLNSIGQYQFTYSGYYKASQNAIFDSKVYDDLKFYTGYDAVGGPSFGRLSYTSYLTSFASSGLVVTPGVDVELGVVAPSEDELSVGYPEWYKNALTVVDPNTGKEITVLPVPQVDTYEGTLGLTQTDIWAGTQVGTNTGTGTGTGTQVGTGTLAGTNTETFVSSLADAIVTPVVNAITAVFVPSQDFLTAKVEALASKFGFAAAIVETVNVLKDGLNGVTTEPPVIYLDLGASRGSYELGGKVPFLDLAWYAEYKPTVDKLISAFLWICFIWRMFLKLPGIISGMPGDFVAGFAQDMGIMNHLPSRSADLARERVEIRQSIWKGRK